MAWYRVYGNDGAVEGGVVSSPAANALSARECAAAAVYAGCAVITNGNDAHTRFADTIIFNPSRCAGAQVGVYVCVCVRGVRARGGAGRHGAPRERVRACVCVHLRARSRLQSSSHWNVYPHPLRPSTWQCLRTRLPQAMAGGTTLSAVGTARMT